MTATASTQLVGAVLSIKNKDFLFYHIYFHKNQIHFGLFYFVYKTSSDFDVNVDIKVRKNSVANRTVAFTWQIYFCIIFIKSYVIKD